MRVRITDPAKADLSNIRLHLQSQSAAAARKIGRSLLDACLSLAEFPRRNRVGSLSGTFESVAVWPYVIVYRITETEVQILRVWHGAQDRAAD
jgi:plasmid stabilization system protein ParE